MNKSLRAVSSVIVAALLTVNLAACGSNTGSEPSGTASSTSAQAETVKPITITYSTFTVGTDAGAPLLQKQLADFPKTKLGEGITVKIEEVPGVDSYAQKMKLLVSSGDLPDIVEPTGANLMDMAIKANKIADLTPYINADPEFKASYDPRSLEYNTRDGKIYGLPNSKEVAYIYYNKELFQKAGVEVPKTWDDFWKACDKLKAANITPLGMDTADFAWCTSLFFFALTGTNGDAGNKWANTQLPKDFNTPEVINAFAKIQMMFKQYTTKDAVGAKYDNVANHFFQGDVAMMANGPWMIGDFSNSSKAPQGFYDKVGIMLFPGDAMTSVPAFGYLVGAKDNDKISAAINFIRYITSPEQQVEMLKANGNFPESPKSTVPEDLLKQNPLLASAIDITKTAKIMYGENQAYWYPNTLDVLSAELPELAFGKITPEQIAQKLTEAAQKNKS